jgi:arylsulfatase
LYDITADRTEQHDLAATRPADLKRLSAEWDGYAARANVLPLGAWRDKPAKRGTRLNKLTHFALTNDEHLKRAQSPDVADRGFTIKADFDAQPGGGVIVAQGGLAQGYTLFLDSAGKLTFLVRIDGQTSSVTATDSALGAHTATAHLAADGTLTLTLDGKAPAQGKAPSALIQMPVEGLDVGSDSGAPVGPYGKSNSFHGTIRSVTIDLEAEAKGGGGNVE